jgi:nitrite reductase/ring-hydroxylating ferredoxin subunit
MMPMADPTHDATPSPCHGCATRRAFVRHTVAAAGALLTGGALTALQALPGPAARAVRYPLPAADGASIDADQEIILVRAAGFVYAFALSCPHQNTALKALPRGGGFQCARHKSRYRPSGEFISGRATRHMDRLAIVRDGAEVVVDPGKAFESDVDLAGWQGARVPV